MGVRVVGVILVFVLGAYSLYMLRYAYDQGDLKKASRFIHEFKPRGGDKTLMGLMAAELGVAETDMACEGEIRSRYEGRIGVRCAAAEGAVASDKGKVFLMEIEVVGFRYKALNPAAQALFEGSVK